MKIPEGKEDVHQQLAEMDTNHEIIAGVDEVGRGSLFGPVFAAAVILNKLDEIKLLNLGLKDSKKLSGKQISFLAPLIKQSAQCWGLGQASAKEIDEVGIREGTEKAMIRALQRLLIKPEIVLVDGNLPIKKWKGPQKTIIKGDSYFSCIAAASVIAKEARDKLIQRLSENFPEYGLKTNVGYGTIFHRHALKIQGPTNLHRLTFLKKILKAEDKN